MSSILKLTMLVMKLSFRITGLIFFQSFVSSPNRRQMDSKASFTAAGGLPIALTSIRCCFFIELTAIKGMEKRVQHAKTNTEASPISQERKDSDLGENSEEQDD
uniref:Uncharacterized protein n=1 Tax=Podarcis muralis TaxID=64176 RepID=A0A670HSU0_PODMU